MWEGDTLRLRAAAHSSAQAKAVAVSCADFYEYSIILYPDFEEGGYAVTVPALPGCVTQGETIEEAIAMAKDAIRLYVETMRAEGEQVPTEGEHPQSLVITGAA